MRRKAACAGHRSSASWKRNEPGKETKKQSQNSYDGKTPDSSIPASQKPSKNKSQKLNQKVAPFVEPPQTFPHNGGPKWRPKNGSEKGPPFRIQNETATLQAPLSHVPEKVAKQILPVWTQLSPREPMQSGGARPYEPPRFVRRRYPHHKNCRKQPETASSSPRIYYMHSNRIACHRTVPKSLQTDAANQKTATGMPPNKKSHCLAWHSLRLGSSPAQAHQQETKASCDDCHQCCTLSDTRPQCGLDQGPKANDLVLNHPPTCSPRCLEERRKSRCTSKKPRGSHGPTFLGPFLGPKRSPKIGNAKRVNDSTAVGLIETPDGAPVEADRKTKT
jgi:hypothetical protein